MTNNLVKVHHGAKALSGPDGDLFYTVTNSFVWNPGAERAIVTPERLNLLLAQGMIILNSQEILSWLLRLTKG